MNGPLLVDLSVSGKFSKSDSSPTRSGTQNFRLAFMRARFIVHLIHTVVLYHTVILYLGQHAHAHAMRINDYMKGSGG